VTGHGDRTTADWVDRQPPETRLALRALAAGVPLDELPGLLRSDPELVRRRLRTAARTLPGGSPPADGDDALLAALAPAVDLARQPPRRRPSTVCLPLDVAAALARGELDGPLFLAAAEHVADCPACLARVLGVRAGTVSAPPGEPVATGVWPVVLGALSGLAAALAYLFLR
jgi:hypothetical protein